MTGTLSTEELLVTICARCEAADVGDVTSQYHCVLELVQLLGYQYAVYSRRRPFPLSRPRYETFHNLPERMSELGKPPWPTGGSSRVKFWQAEALHTGLVHWGWAVTLGPGTGWEATMVAISELPQPVDSKVEALALVTAHLGHWQLSRALEQQLVRTHALSQKEREVMRWTADGKTSGEISYLLAVSENTVNFHLKNVKAKLAASTKTSSAVYAAILGLLS